MNTTQLPTSSVAEPKVINILDTNIITLMRKEVLDAILSDKNKTIYAFTTSLISELVHELKPNEPNLRKEFLVKLSAMGRMHLYDMQNYESSRQQYKEIDKKDQIKNINEISLQPHIGKIKGKYDENGELLRDINIADKDITYMIREILMKKQNQTINLFSDDLRLFGPYIQDSYLELIKSNPQTFKNQIFFNGLGNKENQPIYDLGVDNVKIIKSTLGYNTGNFPVIPHTFIDTAAWLKRDIGVDDNSIRVFIEKKKSKQNIGYRSAQPALHLETPLGVEIAPLVHHKHSSKFSPKALEKPAPFPPPEVPATSSPPTPAPTPHPTPTPDTSKSPTGSSGPKRMFPLLAATGAAAAVGGAAAMAGPVPAEPDQAGINIPVIQKPAAPAPTEERGFFGRMWGGLTEEVGALIRDPQKTLMGYAQTIVTTIQPALKPIKNLIDRPAENIQAFVDEIYEQGKYAVNNPLQTLRNTAGMAANTVTMVGDVAGLAFGAVNAAGRYVFDPNASLSDVMTSFTPEGNPILRYTDVARDEIRAFLGAEKPESIFGQVMESIVQTVATLGMGALVKGASKGARVGVDLLTMGGASTPAGQQLVEGVGGAVVGAVASSAAADAPASPGDPPPPANAPTGSAPFRVEHARLKTPPSGIAPHEPGQLTVEMANALGPQLQAILMAVTTIEARLGALESTVSTLQAGLPADIIRVVDAALAQRRATQDYSQLRDALPSGQMRGVYNSLQPTAGL